MLDSSYKPTVYIGPSMNPTLKATDILEIVPYNNENEIQPGDVIVFNSPQAGKNITHRVISVTKQGIQTRGDNNSKPDSYLLKMDNIKGRVTHAKRGKRNIAIHGGRNGQIYVALIRARRLMLRATFKTLKHPYHWMANTGFFQKLTPQPRIINYTRRNNVEEQLMLGPLVIGRCRPGRSWNIKKPFRLFIDGDIFSR